MLLSVFTFLTKLAWFVICWLQNSPRKYCNHKWRLLTSPTGVDLNSLASMQSPSGLWDKRKISDTLLLENDKWMLNTWWNASLWIFFLFANYIISLVFHNQKNLITGGGYNFKHQENCQVITSLYFLTKGRNHFIICIISKDRDTSSTILKSTIVSYIIWNAYYVHFDLTFNFQKDQNSFKLKYSLYALL